MKSNLKTGVLWTLVVLNAVLLTVALMRHARGDEARAQAGGRPGDYMTVPATMSSAPNGLVFVLDTTNRSLSGVSYNNATKQLQSLPKIDLDRIFSQANQGFGGPGAGAPKVGGGYRR